MLCVSSKAACLRQLVFFVPLGLAAALSATGCGHTPEHERAKKARSAVVSQPPLHRAVPPAAGGPTAKAEDKFAVPYDEEGEWVPMTGSENVIVDDLSLLTDGAPVKSAPADPD